MPHPPNHPFTIPDWQTYFDAYPDKIDDLGRSTTWKALDALVELSKVDGEDEQAQIFETLRDHCNDRQMFYQLVKTLDDDYQRMLWEMRANILMDPDHYDEIMGYGGTTSESKVMPAKTIFEGFGVGDLEFVIHPLIHIDEFKSKLGTDHKNIVVSFMLDDKHAAADLVDFLERGYEFILDADVSASEIKPGSYLVFMEIPRRTRFIPQLIRVLSDLTAASGFNKEDWKFQYMKEPEKLPLNADNLREKVPTSPRKYRELYVDPLEKLQADAGIPIKSNPAETNEARVLQHSAGIR